MLTTIRNKEVNDAILECLSTYLKSYNKEELSQSLADYSLPASLVKAIETGLSQTASEKKSEQLDSYVTKQKKEDRLLGADSTQWIVYDSREELAKLSAQKGKRIDELNRLISKAQHNYTALPTNHHYATPYSSGDFFSGDEYWYQRRQYFDLRTRIEAIKDEPKRNELWALFHSSFHGENTKPIYTPRVAYKSSMPILTKKLYWAIQLQKLQDELNDLLAWDLKPKISSSEYPFRKQRAQIQLPVKATNRQKLDFLVCSNREDYQTQARVINEEFKPLTPAECTQIIIRLLNRVNKTLQLDDINIPHIKQFSMLQIRLIDTLKLRIDLKRNSVVDKTLMDLQNRIANVSLDSDADPQVFYTLIDDWRRERSPLEPGKTKGELIKPSGCGLFKSREQGILEQLIDLITRLTIQIQQQIPSQGYMVLGYQNNQALIQ